MAERIIALRKGALEGSCGPLNAIRTLGLVGFDTLCICSTCLPETEAELRECGVTVRQIHPELPSPAGLISKLNHYRRFGKRAWQIIDSEAPDTLLWVAKIDTAMALGKRLLDKRYVLTLQELHDNYFWHQRAIGVYAPKAKVVVVPEYCRANILRCWHHLEMTPCVLPNKARPLLRHRNLPITDPKAAHSLKSILGNQRILLYQGGISERRDLQGMAAAAHQLGEGYRLVAMGQARENTLAELRRICPNLIYVPWVRPPLHLEITSHAHIGIAFYKFDSLNSIFCAPNKTWEYAAFGIPVVCQDIPGLRYSVGSARAGCCISSEDPVDLANAVKTIEQDYTGYSSRAHAFYESVDVNAIVSDIVSRAWASDRD